MNRREFVGACALLAAASAFGVPTGKPSGFQAAMKSKPVAKRLFAFRLDQLPKEQRELELTVTCLQGLVNRRRPELYLVQDQYDSMWLDWLKERGDIREVVWLDL